MNGHQIPLAAGYNKPHPEQSHKGDTRPIWTLRGWAIDRSPPYLADRELVFPQ